MVPTSGMLCHLRAQCERMRVRQQQEPPSGRTHPIPERFPLRKAGLRTRFLSDPIYQHGLILTRTLGSSFNHAALFSKQQISIVKSDCREF